MKVDFVKSALKYWLLNSSVTGYPALSNSFVLVRFNKPKRTGKLFGINVYNHIFVKVQGEWFTPIIYPVIRNVGISSDEFFKPSVRVNKMMKYYSEGMYNDINNVVVYGDNHTTNFLMLLALWTPPELVERLYGVDKRLIGKYHSVISMQLSMEYSLVRPGLIDFIVLSKMLFSTNLVPLLYRDGVFVANINNMVRDLSVYIEQSAKDVVKNIINVYSDPSFNYEKLVGGKRSNLPWTVFSYMYPFIIWRIPTDYGYIVNYSMLDYSSNVGSVKFVRVDAPPQLRYKKNIRVRYGWDSVFISSNYDVAVDDEYLYLWEFDTNLVKVKLSDVQTAFIGYRSFSKYNRLYGIYIKKTNGSLNTYSLSTDMFKQYRRKPTIILKK